MLSIEGVDAPSRPWKLQLPAGPSALHLLRCWHHARKTAGGCFINFYLTYVNEVIDDVGYFPANDEALLLSAKRCLAEDAMGMAMWNSADG